MRYIQHYNDYQKIDEGLKNKTEGVDLTTAARHRHLLGLQVQTLDHLGVVSVAETQVVEELQVLGKKIKVN